MTKGSNYFSLCGQEVLMEEGTSNQWNEQGEGAGPWSIQWKNIPWRENSRCKGPEVQACLEFWENLQATRVAAMERDKYSNTRNSIISTLKIKGKCREERLEGDILGLWHSGGFYSLPFDICSILNFQLYVYIILERKKHKRVGIKLSMELITFVLEAVSEPPVKGIYTATQAVPPSEESPLLEKQGKKFL